MLRAMECPHCTISFHPQPQEHRLQIPLFDIVVLQQACPACGKQILQFIAKSRTAPPVVMVPQRTVFPPNAKLVVSQISPEIKEPYRKDFEEAVDTLLISPKASAALSRRIIQAILREKAAVTPGRLTNEIEEVLKNKSLPTFIADDLHALRKVGNLAVHETKDSVTGDIIDVEPAEAEWTLKVAGSMLEFYFIEPAKQARRRAELDEKLAAAKKPKEMQASTFDSNPT
jgi:hypothetical protein